MSSLLLFLSTAAGSASTPAPADEPFTPAKAASNMQLPEGFQATLFAGEPDVVQPVSFAIDHRGRLWVAEALNYPERFAEPKDRIVIFEDRDGDGKADKHTVFYDKLGYVTGLEVGFGGVWVMSPPNMYFIPDRNGDDKPDSEPQILLDGFGIKESKHNLANGFTWGPDGWLYAGHGRTSPSDVGKPGTPADKRTHFDGGVFRYHPTRHVFEVFADGTTNPWGVDFDDYGEPFVSNCVNPHIFHIIQGAHYEPWRNRPSSQFAYDRLRTIADHLHWADGKGYKMDRDDLPKLVTTGGGHAHVGMMIYLGNNWPDAYRNDAFMFNVHGRRLNHDHLARNGSGYVATHREDFMQSSDPWFMGVTVRYGPDGGVFMSDWSDTGECHSYVNTRRETGRIYKVTYRGKDGKDAPLALPTDVAKLTEAELVKLHLHKNDWWVRHARLALQERATAGKDMAGVRKALLTMFETNPDVTRKLRALWTLAAIDGANEDFLLEQLGHRDEHVRAWAVRLLTDQAKLPGTALNRFGEMAVKDSSPIVRRYLASALQRLPLADRWTIGEGLASHADDVNDPNLPLMIWYGIEPLVKSDTPRAMKLMTRVKIPVIRQFIARRAAETE